MYDLPNPGCQKYGNAQAHEESGGKMVKSETTLNSETVYDGSWIKVRRDTVVETVSRRQALQMVLDGTIKDGKSVAGILMLESASLHNDAGNESL